MTEREKQYKSYLEDSGNLNSFLSSEERAAIKWADSHPVVEWIDCSTALPEESEPITKIIHLNNEVLNVTDSFFVVYSDGTVDLRYRFQRLLQSGEFSVWKWSHDKDWDEWYIPLYWTKYKIPTPVQQKSI